MQQFRGGYGVHDMRSARVKAFKSVGVPMRAGGDRVFWRLRYSILKLGPRLRELEIWRGVSSVRRIQRSSAMGVSNDLRMAMGA